MSWTRTARALVLPAALALCLVNAGLAAAPRGPTATLSVTHTADAYQGDSQFIDAWENETCTQPKKGKRLISFGAKLETRTAAIPAGAPVFLVVQTNAGAGRRCISIASLTPEEGHTYALAHEALATGCVTHLIDTATNRPPASFKTWPRVNPCLPKDMRGKNYLKWRDVYERPQGTPLPGYRGMPGAP